MKSTPPELDDNVIGVDCVASLVEDIGPADNTADNLYPEVNPMSDWFCSNWTGAPG